MKSIPPFWTIFQIKLIPVSPMWKFHWYIYIYPLMDIYIYIHKRLLLFSWQIENTEETRVSSWNRARVSHALIAIEGASGGGRVEGKRERRREKEWGRGPVCTSNFLFLITDCISGIFACDIRTRCKLTGLNAPADCINLIKRGA